MSSLINLFWSFIIIGIGAYGGGIVTIPLIQHEIVTIKKWLSFKEMAEVIAIAQMTPGPIAINSATFTGFRMGSFLGAIIATIAVIAPSMLILSLLTPLINRYKKNKYMLRFRLGMQIGVLSLIFFAVWSYGSSAIKGYFDFGIAIYSFLFLVIFERKIHPILIILSCGFIGTFIFK